MDGTTLARWDGDGSTHTLDLPCNEVDDRARDNCGGMPLVRVPSGVTLTVRARDAGIDVSDVRGELSLSTVNGDVTVQDSGAKEARQHLVTRNGSVRATGLAARELGAETVNGDVDLLCTTSPDALHGVTRNGSVRVTLPAGAPPYATDASTVNGRSTVDVPAADPADHPRRLTLRSVNGDTEVHRGDPHSRHPPARAHAGRRPGQRLDSAASGVIAEPVGSYTRLTAGGRVTRIGQPSSLPGAVSTGSFGTAGQTEGQGVGRDDRGDAGWWRWRWRFQWPLRRAGADSRPWAGDRRVRAGLPRRYRDPQDRHSGRGRQRRHVSALRRGVQPPGPESGPRKPAGLTELPGQLKGSGGRGMAKGVLSGAAEAMSDAFHQARGEGRSRRG